MADNFSWMKQYNRLWRDGSNDGNGGDSEKERVVMVILTWLSLIKPLFLNVSSLLE